MLFNNFHLDLRLLVKVSLCVDAISAKPLFSLILVLAFHIIFSHTCGVRHVLTLLYFVVFLYTRDIGSVEEQVYDEFDGDFSF